MPASDGSHVVPSAPAALDCFEIMRSRRSIRRFCPEPPPRETLATLVEAAVMAPSASNQQPWRFLVVRRREVIQGMAAAVRSAVDSMGGHVAPELASWFRDYPAWFSSFEDAPALIVALCHTPTLLSGAMAQAPQHLQQVAAELEHDSAMMSVAMALQNLLLCAHALGLGAAIMTGPRLAEPEVRQLLQVQPAWRIAAVVPVGYPAEVPPPPRHKPIDRVLGWIE